MTDVAFLRTGAFDVTPAIPRYMAALKLAWPSATVVAIEYREGEEPQRGDVRRHTKGIRHGRSPHAPVALGGWQIFAFRALLREKPQLVQFSDAFCAVPAVLAAKTLKARLVYDIRDNVRASTGHRSKIAAAILGAIEDAACQLSDAVVIVEESRRELLPKRVRGRALMIPNVPTDSVGGRVPQSPRAMRRDVPLVNLSGFVSSRRNAAAWLELAFAGKATVQVYGNIGADLDIEEFRSAGCSVLEACSNAEATDRLANADAVSLMYDPSVKINQYAAPNKYYEALMLGRPVIVAQGMALADEVASEKIGWVVRYGDSSALASALREMTRSELDERGVRARNTYERRYRGIAEERMRALYSRLSTGLGS